MVCNNHTQLPLPTTTDILNSAVHFSLLYGGLVFSIRVPSQKKISFFFKTLFNLLVGSHILLDLH